MAFCSPPFASVTTSWLKAGARCCLAQLWSAAMLTVVDFGTAPTNLTTPLRVAVPAVVLLTEAGGPAFTAFRLEMQIIAVRASIGMSLFVVFVVMQNTFCPGRGGHDLS